MTALAAEPLLRIEGLRTVFERGEATVVAVDGIDLELRRGEILGLVGESGCGKSVTGLSIMGLVPDPPGRIEAGRIHFEGRDLLALDGDSVRRLRGRRLAMIFQEPMSALNPIRRVGEQIAEGLRLHLGLSKRAAAARAVELLAAVGIPDPERRSLSYPFQLSGGMRQRVMIAMAIACDPALIVADEPTTALDVTIQAQILDLLRGIQARTGAAIILITHDLGVIAETADRVAVMYAGRIVESATVERLFAAPLHPYTAGLLRSRPDLDQPPGEDRSMAAIPGTVPSLAELPSGCAFRTRCGQAMARCAAEKPSLREAAAGHAVACWLHGG